MSELKPCPFCGGKARIREYKDEKNIKFREQGELSSDNFNHVN